LRQRGANENHGFLERSIMKGNRITACALLAIACGALLTACNFSDVPSDLQLKRLLHGERAAATDPDPALDVAAVKCLRAWSGDVELTAALPPSLTDEAGKTACRQRIDAWIADATRNPDKLRFEDVSAPPSVKRLTALLAEQRGNESDHAPSANDRPPPMAMKGSAMPAAPAEPVDMTAAIAAVGELEHLCQTMKDTVARGGASQSAIAYAGYCDKRIALLRTRISTIQQQGNATQAQIMTTSVQRTLDVARQISARASQPKPTPNP
jgi:hypothetical protein